MGISKTSLFSEDQNRLAELAKALGHPARIAILQHLIKKGSCICGDIVEELPLSQATVSQHLKALKEVGIIKGEIEGATRCYCLNSNCCSDLMNQFSNLFSKLRNCC